MAYQQMATLYDKLMKEAPYDQWAKLANEIFRDSTIPINEVVDLGCGTGQITTRLAKLGFQMTGVDYSVDMLSFAEQRANEEKVNAHWIHQDLRSLHGLRDIDAVVSFCDVMNYITTEKELKAVFTNISTMLKENGIFIFDVHSMYHVEHNLVNQTFATVDDDLSSIWFCSPGEDSGEMYHDLTFFVSSDTGYSRFDEYHHQRTFPLETYQGLLKENNLYIRNVFGDFSNKECSLEENSERIFFVAEKRSGK